MTMTKERAVVLIVDADALSLTASAAVLSISGYECQCAQDGEAALKAIRTLPIDLIICDVNLRGSSGIELCRDLRAEPNGRDVPVMFISATQLPDVVRRVHDTGGTYFLRKPFDPGVLIELVNRALWMPHLVQSRIQHNGTPTVMTMHSVPQNSLSPNS